MKYLYTKNEHYKLFKNKYGNVRLSKNLKLYTTSKEGIFEKFGLINEIFEKPIQTEYIIDREKSEKYGEWWYKVLFKSDSDTEYRLDIWPTIENGKGLVNHISFSLSDRDFIDDVEGKYEKMTGKNEMIEILNRLHYVIKDLISKKKIENYFCIGLTELEEKNDIYEYFLKKNVGEGGIDKLKTNIYPVGYGLYFKI